MKPYTFFILLICTLHIKAYSQNSSTLENKKKNIDVSFNCHQTFDSLVLIRQELIKHNIELHYINVTFNKSGHLSGINFMVDCKDGFEGSAHLNTIYCTNKIGFYRHYDDSTSSPFGTVLEK